MHPLSLPQPRRAYSLIFTTFSCTSTAARSLSTVKTSPASLIWLNCWSKYLATTSTLTPPAAFPASSCAFSVSLVISAALSFSAVSCPVWGAPAVSPAPSPVCCPVLSSACSPAAFPGSVGGSPAPVSISTAAHLAAISLIVPASLTPRSRASFCISAFF